MCLILKNASYKNNIMKTILKIILISTFIFLFSSCSKSENRAQSSNNENNSDGNDIPDKVNPKELASNSDNNEENSLQEHVVIKTTCGDIKGIKKSEYTVFKGIQYATAERWEDAIQTTEWIGEYDATEFGDWACQFKGFFGTDDSNVTRFYHDEATIHFPVDYSENCLNLNVWTPNNAQDCPVLVFIHGGSFLTGGNSDSYIDGKAYAKKGIIMISINYRLGPFAALYGDGFTGNYQMTDQITAIKWIQDNIKDYGGDPNKITIMGESAGALSVQNILISPLSEGLIQGAIMMSGGGDLSVLGTPTSPDKIEAIWTKMKEKFQVENISELKSINPVRIFSTWMNVCAEMPNYSITSTAPIINGTVLPTNVKDALNDKMQANVPCIFGVLSEDMWPYTLYNAAIEYGVSQYNAQNSPVYTYYFDRQLPGNNNFGAFHAADLWYMFGTLNRNWRPFDEIDFRISENMIDYVSNFVKTGDPNDVSLPEWNPITAENQLSLRFGDEEPSMYGPSLDELANTQKTRPAFPYK